MLGQLLDDATRRFKESGIDSALLDARLLAEQVLGWDGGKVIARLNYIPTSQQCKRFEEMVVRRADREPVALILGHTEFWSLKFKVNADVLLPRPDSETLIEAALSIKGINNKECSILDLGTGSGCLLLALLYELPKAKGLGVDISSVALDVAKGNLQHLGMENRAYLQLADWDKDVEGLYDLVISNPPYISENDYFSLERDITAFEPKLSLFGGQDGLDCYRSLGPAIVRKLTDNGRALIEIGYNQKKKVCLILEKVGLKVRYIHQDLAGHPRVIEAELKK